uniref:Uncharacterized protein n=1 Tax=Arundo donax TaxID=35708 RepID=A0A0A9ETL0_ARUDO
MKDTLKVYLAASLPDPWRMELLDLINLWI